jgi:hypothetical protein
MDIFRPSVHPTEEVETLNIVDRSYNRVFNILYPYLNNQVQYITSGTFNNIYIRIRIRIKINIYIYICIYWSVSDLFSSLKIMVLKGIMITLDIEEVKPWISNKKKRELDRTCCIA